MPALAAWIATPAIALSAMSFDASPARAEFRRWVGVGVVTGARTFASPLALQSEVSIGARVSMGVSEHVVVMIDGAHASPTRRTSRVSSSFGDVRVLTAYRFLSGSCRPYLVAGLGGQFFNFYDAQGAAGAVVASGVGLDLAASPEWALFGEAVVDLYRAKFVTYDDTGQTVDSGPTGTYGTGVFTVGVQYRF